MPCTTGSVRFVGKNDTYLDHKKAEHRDAGEVETVRDLVHSVVFVGVVRVMWRRRRRPGPGDRCRLGRSIGRAAVIWRGEEGQRLPEQSQDEVDVGTVVAVQACRLCVADVRQKPGELSISAKQLICPYIHVNIIR